jgi:chromate transport protein ChrA
VTGTENVCRAALAAGVRRVVHMSSSSVYGMGLGRPADETFPLAPFPDPYPITKAAADMTVQRMIAEDGLPAVIIRPDQIFGPGDHLHFGRMADRLRAGRTVIVGSGHNALPFVYVTDVIHGLLLALDHRRAIGHAYNITSDRPLTQRQLLDAVAVGQVTPGPVFTTATFIGYVLGGGPGAVVATLGIFLPAFVFPIFFHRQLVAVANSARLHPFLLGVAAGVIGLIASVTVHIVDTSVVDIYTAVLAIGAFLVLNRYHDKLTVLYVVLGCGLIGALLQATIV